MDGVFKLPTAMRRDLAILIIVKLAMLSVLYCLFFAPSHRPAVDVMAHIAGAAVDR
jgi:hypothetical protein